MLLKGKVATSDAAVFTPPPTDAGLVCLGKTHMSELAFSGLGVNPVAATPPNAFEPERAPWRLLVGRCGFHCAGSGGGGDRFGHRRVGAYPGGVERAGRAEDNGGGNLDRRGGAAIDHA